MSDNNICQVCGREIKIAIRKGTRICSGTCAKKVTE